jgi:hypothetical protein
VGETILDGVERKQVGVDTEVSSFGSGMDDEWLLSSAIRWYAVSGRAVARVRLLRLLTVKGVVSADHDRLNGGGESTVASDGPSGDVAVAEFAKF